MTITIERHNTRNGEVYWTTEHSDTHYRITHDTFADVLEYLEVWCGIQKVE